MSARPLSLGDVVLITFPFTDLSGAKLRPAVILARSSGDDVIVAFVTSRSRTIDPQAESFLDPVDSEFPLTGLKGASTIRLDKIATLHRSLVQRRIGHVGPRQMTAVQGALRYVFHL